jgi:hypothetical protein
VSSTIAVTTSASATRIGTLHHRRHQVQDTEDGNVARLNELGEEVRGAQYKSTISEWKCVILASFFFTSLWFTSLCAVLRCFAPDCPWIHTQVSLRCFALFCT